VQVEDLQKNEQPLTDSVNRMSGLLQEANESGNSTKIEEATLALKEATDRKQEWKKLYDAAVAGKDTLTTRLDAIPAEIVVLRTSLEEAHETKQNAIDVVSEINALYEIDAI
jgi:hypothetical protein